MSGEDSKIDDVKEAEEILDKRFGKGYTKELRAKFKEGLEEMAKNESK